MLLPIVRGVRVCAAFFLHMKCFFEMFLFAQKNKRKKKNNDTLWHAFVININELRNEPRRIEDKAGQS